MESISSAGSASASVSPQKPERKRKRNSSHGYYCCVPLCRNRSTTHPLLSFHNFPNNDSRKEARRAWIRAIRRDEGPNFRVTLNTRVCSEHFLPEDFRQSPYSSIASSSRKMLTPGAVPSVFAWPKKESQPSRPPPRERSEVEFPESKRRRRCARAVPAEVPDPVRDPQADAGPTVSRSELADLLSTIRREHDYRGILPDGSNLPDGVLQHIRSLQQTVASLEGQVLDLKSRMTTVENLKGKDADFSAATGLPNYAVFKALLKYLSPKAQRMMWWRGKATVRRLCRPRGTRLLRLAYQHRLSVEDQFFSILVRLRTGVSVREISRRLKITQSAFSIMFTTWINVLCYELEALNKATSQKRATRGAASFQNFPDTRIVIDCTEVFTQRPSGLKARKQLFSTYKHHATIKFLVGASPNGSVLYVSKVWGGRASDKKITCDADSCLQMLKPGEAVMADRGFLIADEVVERGCKLHIPAFLGSDRSQLTAAEVTQTRRIARARIHIERAIQRIKLFRILQWFPLSLLMSVSRCSRSAPFSLISRNR